MVLGSQVAESWSRHKKHLVRERSCLCLIYCTCYGCHEHSRRCPNIVSKLPVFCTTNMSRNCPEVPIRYIQQFHTAVTDLGSRLASLHYHPFNCQCESQVVMCCEFDMTHVETCHYRKKFMTCTNVNGSLVGDRNIDYPHSTVAIRLILQGNQYQTQSLHFWRQALIFWHKSHYYLITCAETRQDSRKK